MIWPESASQMPDIVLSIGAGLARGELSPGNRWWDWLPSGLAQGVKVLVDIKEATVNCERLWSEVFNYTSGNQALRERYHRVNILLSKTPCELDDVGALKDLESEARTFLDQRGEDSYDKRFANCRQQLKAIAVQSCTTFTSPIPTVAYSLYIPCAETCCVFGKNPLDL